MDIPELDKKGLRQFGLTTGAIIVVLFAIVFPWLFEIYPMPLWPWIIAAVLWIPAILFPVLLKPVYIVWMKFGHALGWVNSRIILGVIFYIMVLPMGLIMRLLGHDPMDRKFNSSIVSYRQESEKQPVDRLEKPY